MKISSDYFLNFKIKTKNKFCHKQTKYQIFNKFLLIIETSDVSVSSECQSRLLKSLVLIVSIVIGGYVFNSINHQIIIPLYVLEWDTQSF